MKIVFPFFMESFRVNGYVNMENLNNRDVGNIIKAS